MKEMCKIIPYRCPKCNNDLLFFVSQRNPTRLVDYKNLMNTTSNISELKEYLYHRSDLSYLKCLCCNKLYIIDWTHEYPIPLTDKNVLSKFGY